MKDTSFLTSLRIDLGVVAGEEDFRDSVGLALDFEDFGAGINVVARDSPLLQRFKFA